MIYNVTDYGVIGNGAQNNTAAINALTKKLQKTGGTIYFPAGEYVIGSIHLYSNMTLLLDAGATILGSHDFNDYPFIELEGFTRGTRHGLISAVNARNIRITGGKIDGRGKYFWDNMESDYERPRTIHPILCKDVSITDIIIENSPCWTVHPLLCENVSIRGVSIYNPYDSPNTDGINPESCRNVRITDCHIDVGDDCVTIKAGTELDSLMKARPCENIIVSGCTMAHGHGGVVIGSEMSGGVKNVSVTNCVFQNTERGIRIKTRRKRGGYVKGATFSNIIMENVGAVITMNAYYCCVCGEYPFPKEMLFDEGAQPLDDLTPRFSDIRISGITARGVTGVGIYLYGLPESPIEKVAISDISMEIVGCEDGFPPVSAFNRPLCYGEGILIENASDVSILGANIRCSKERLILKNAKNVMLNGEPV
jgi:galacturan 1,4-alpha-galacturonidase